MPVVAAIPTVFIMPCNNHSVGENKFLVACFVSASVISLSVFIAPFFLEKNTVGGLDGNAWKIDYGSRWDRMPPFQRAVYYFGDINCHQKYYRSYFINGNQMPVCARDTGLLAGLSLGFFIAIFSTEGKNVKDTVANLFRGRIKGTGIPVALLAFLILPSVADGFLQMFTGYESTNIVRTATGFLLGMGVSLLASIPILTDPRIK